MLSLVVAILRELSPRGGYALFLNCVRHQESIALHHFTINVYLS